MSARWAALCREGFCGNIRLDKTEAFVPCGHVFACEACAQALIRRTGVCPVCRRTVSSTLRVYV